MKKIKPIIYDPVIVPRVKRYLEDNVDKTYLDVAVMTRHLQKRYPEYARRKMAPFRVLVEQAYRVVSKSYGLEVQSTSPEDSNESDVEVMDAAPSNSLNNMMNDMYSKPKNKTPEGTAPRSTTAAESIDISSEESVDEEHVNERQNEATASSSCVRPHPNQTLRKSANIKTTNAFNRISGNPSKKQKVDGSTEDKQQEPPLHPRNLLRAACIQKMIDLGSANNELLRKEGNQNDGLNRSHPTKERKYKKEVRGTTANESFQDVGGMEKTLKEVCELLMHMKSPEVYLVLGLVPPRGILLHGPSGCGKTLLARAIAGQFNLPLIEVPATELIAGVSGESEERIRDVFEQASLGSPCVLFIDEIDAISANRVTAQKDMERRVVSQLISSLDSLHHSASDAVVVIGATTKPELLDPALRRVGRFDHEIAIGIPSRKDRKDILTVISSDLSIHKDIDFGKIAELTPGFVGADLLALVSRAATIAVKRKCTEKMRAFQAETQRNMPIVDLDDDDKAKRDIEASSTQQANVTESSVQEKSNEPDKEKANKVVKATESATNGIAQVEANEVQFMEINSGDEIDDPTNTKGNTSEAEAEGSRRKSESGDIDVTTSKTGTTKAHVELSLLEWLNWLENPMELSNDLEEFCVTPDDFVEALKVVQPSAKREGFVTVPDVTWNDIGSLEGIRKELKLAVLAPVKYPEVMECLGLTAPSGVLLCGPPGCGKTLLAKAVANEAGINFISVKGPELMNMYVGESERAVRVCFQRARNSAPCVIFFDEFDSLCPKRSEDNVSGSSTRIVNQLLTEMDGVEHRQGVYILAATNRPDIIDPAIMRPGRLDKILYVGMPEAQDREEILKATTKNRTRPILNDDVDFRVLAERSEGYTGADLACLVREAAMIALQESLEKNIHVDDLCVRMVHFKAALEHMRPSVDNTDRMFYEELRLKYAVPMESAAVSSEQHIS